MDVGTTQTCTGLGDVMEHVVNIQEHVPVNHLIIKLPGCVQHMDILIVCFIQTSNSQRKVGCVPRRTKTGLVIDT